MTEPTPLGKEHDTSEFDCGKESLNAYLRSYALTNQQGGLSRTYVTCAGNKVVGYYSLAPTALEPSEAPGRIMKGQPRHLVPCILLARLAVDQKTQGSGLGKFLFRDALLRALNAQSQIGGRAFLVHAMDEEARAFYMRYGMLPSPTHPLHLFLLFKDIRAMLGVGN